MHRGMQNNWCPGAMETTWKGILSWHCEAGTRHPEMFLPPPLGSVVNMDTTHHANYWAWLLPKRSQMGQEHHICYCERTPAQTLAANPLFKQFALNHFLLRMVWLRTKGSQHVLSKLPYIKYVCSVPFSFVFAPVNETWVCVYIYIYIKISLYYYMH